MSKQDDLENTEELFAFLQGVKPEGYHIADERMPALTADQAWTVIWFLGNKYWQVTDRIERCDICGELYDSDSGGDCLDGGDPPYHFCDTCDGGAEWTAKKSLTATWCDECGIFVEDGEKCDC